jgi:tetratricopeptide (TPR) repeat protein
MNTKSICYVILGCLLIFLAIPIGCAQKNEPGSVTDAIFPSPVQEEERLIALEAVEREVLDAGKSTQAVPMESFTEDDEIAALKKKKKKADSTTWKRSKITSNTARLKIGDREELLLKGTQINVQVDGFRARVLMDMFFYNDRNRQFEGTFQIRLPNGASPYFLAFGESVIQAESGGSVDIPFENTEAVRGRGWTPEKIVKDRAETWRGVKVAQIVAKDKAALAYRETVRRKADPALMEWSGAGIFSSRVFPLMPHKLHRIVIGYDLNLLQVGKDLEYKLDLPANSSNTVIEISVKRISGVTMQTQPAEEGTSYDGRRHFRFDRPLERSITLTLKQADALMMTLPDTDKSAPGPVFAARFQPEIPQTNSKGASEAVFLVDISASANPDRFNIWLKMLEGILTNNRDQLKSFGVLFFNIESFWWENQLSANTPENVARLIDFSNNLALEGATDLSAALKAATTAKWLRDRKDADVDLFLLSDGAATWGEQDLYALSSMLSQSAGALFAYQTGLAGTDMRMLSHLTRETGGAVFSIVSEAEIEKASRAHRSRPWRISAVAIDGCKDLLLAGRPGSIYSGQQLLLTGRGTPNDDARVQLTLQQGKIEKVIFVPFTKQLESELTQRIYGQVAVDQLESFAYKTRLQSEAYARHFRITGQTCSLLMLESQSDYERFNIKPENDLFVVKMSLVSNIVSKCLEDVALSPGNPRTGFFNRMEQLEKLSQLTFEIAPAFRIALDMLPEKAFYVETPPLVCKSRLIKEIPGLINEQLQKGKPEYDDFMRYAGHLQKKISPDDALKGLSSLIEYRPGDSVLARDIGFSAMEMGLGGQAYHLFRKVADRRPYYPQTYWEMAQCLDDMALYDMALVWYEISLAGQWNNRFGDFRKIVQLDYLRFLRRLKNQPQLKIALPDYVDTRLEQLETNAKIEKFKKDTLVVIITWNTDGSDVDLHVIEPGGEECFYQHSTTRAGGSITRDVTQGFGPEMYFIPDAPGGEYKIRVKYFSKDSNRSSTRTRVFVTIHKNWGTPEEETVRKAVTLEHQQEMHELATVRVKGILW